MSRQARAKCESGIYHVMLRGINKQQIFFDRQDYNKFIQVLIECKKVSGFELYAYCLMPNHVHLLIKEKDETLSTIMKRMGCRFVYWYNAKYQRVGHLFQDRFKSEPVTDDAYFLCALRYIHLNPVEAGFVKNCGEYEYSSFKWYFENGILVDKHLAFSIMNQDQFIEYHKKPGEEKFIDITDSKRVLSDDVARKVIERYAGSVDPEVFRLLEREDRNSFIHHLKKEGLSIRQIVKLTGYSKRVVEKA